MYVGVLTHNYPRFPGDFSGTFVEALCEEYTRQGQRVTVWAPYDPAYVRDRDGEVELKLYRYAWPENLHRLGYMRSMASDLSLRLNAFLLSPGMLASGIATVMREARRCRPHVLHAHWLLPNGYIGAVVSSALGIPLVVSVPGSDARIAGQNALFRAMARYAIRRSDLLTANSVELRDAVLALGAEQTRFDLIIYGTDPATLRPDPKGVLALRQRLDIPANAVVVLCVGRMVPKKGFDDLLRAMSEPALRDREVAAVMVGEGDEWHAWQALADRLGVSQRVRWTGNVPKDDIPVFYNMADMLVMPSVRRPADGLNVCVLDAMSCAKPVVSTDVAGNPLAIVEGETGLIVPERNPPALAAAVARLADDPALRQRMGAAGRTRIETELGWPHLAKRYIEHFRRIVQGMPMCDEPARRTSA
jgi:glycosyltransferase involved in cell wall biosynthesis